MSNRVLCSRGCCLECDECSKKSGSPILCEDCIRRRDECFKRHLGEKPEEDSMWESDTETTKTEGRRGSANDRQVAGAHYKGTTIQHWDFCAANNLDYMQGQITKYVCRWKKKGGLSDLLKAQHFMDKYIELVKAGIITADSTQGESK